MARPIDHLVLAVPDLAAAMELYRRLGFTVGSRNLHPWGTENAVVLLDGSFLELIGLGPGFTMPPRADPAWPFAHRVADAVARGGGLALVALGSSDADSDALVFSAADLGTGRRLDFGRTAEAPDGRRIALRFSLAFAEDPAMPEAGFFTCQHHHGLGAFWAPAGREHANGAFRIDEVALAAEAPARHAGALAAVSGPPAGGGGRLTVDTPTGRIAVLAPSDVEARYGFRATSGRFAGFRLVVTEPGAVRRRLDAAGLPYRAVAGAVVVRPEAAFGAALAFAPEPCHSHRRTEDEP